jgi:hypothetical protein
MDASEAMQMLVRAGRGEEARDVVNRAADSAQAAYRRIRSDDTRTDEFKTEEMKRTYQQVRSEVASKLTRLAQTAQHSERRDAGRVFGTDGVAGDPASLIVSRRDAADRVASVKQASQLRDLLSRATKSGDEILARAVAERAVENGDAATLNAFLADRPQLEEPAQGLWNAARTGDNLNVRFGNTMALFALRPPELSHR